MINTRVIELLQSPANFTEEDLKLIPEEIKKQPYVQSIRALYLYGIQKYQPENYQKVLSETAAFTTDKKILYQFINKKSIPANANVEESLPVAETIVASEEIVSVTNRFNVDKLPNISEFELPKPVYVNGKLNRILFEGEEDLLSRPAEKIDIEATLESGKLVLLKDYSSRTNLPIEETPTNELIPDATKELSEIVVTEKKVVEEAGTPEAVVKPSDNQEVKENIKSSSELSFHGLEDFLPQVKFTPTEIKTEAPKTKPQPDRHALEMQRLIAEVEAKMIAAKKNKKTEVPTQEVPASQEINFAEEMPFAVNPSEKSKFEPVPSIEPVVEATSGWKPMNFQSSVPDALIGKTSSPKDEVIKPLTEIKPSDNSQIHEVKTDLTEVRSEESNVPKFINTWQSWLKLDKKSVEEPKEEPAVSVEKFDPIEKFIEAEPKISRLSEDSYFVVKERNDDISHLMTETLAKLYVEQKLYAKAIRAYENLSVKHPERKAYFAERIRQVKDIRQGK